MSYELYWISGSPNAWRVMLTMEIKRLDYVSHRLDPGKREHKVPEFLALNPHGKVPVLKDGDVIVYESLAIIAYLEAKHPEPALFGGTPEESGLIWQRIFEVMNHVRDVIDDGVVRPLIRGQAAVAGEAIKTAVNGAHEALKWLEGILAESQYLAGNAISAADVSVMPNIQGLIRAGGKEDAVRLNLGFDNFAAVYPCITDWLGRIEALPGYDAAYPPHWRDS